MKKYVWIVALLAALAMVMTGCPSGDSGGGDIGWTAVADGSATATSTKITFTFDADVSVSGADITITKVTGEATKGAISGSGKTWNLAISGVKAGTVTVKISKSGIKEGNKTVTLFTEDYAYHLSKSEVNFYFDELTPPVTVEKGKNYDVTLTISALDAGFNGSHFGGQVFYIVEGSTAVKVENWQNGNPENVSTTPGAYKWRFMNLGVANLGADAIPNDARVYFNLVAKKTWSDNYSDDETLGFNATFTVTEYIPPAIEKKFEIGPDWSEWAWQDGTFADKGLKGKLGPIVSAQIMAFTGGKLIVHYEGTTGSNGFTSANGIGTIGTKGFNSPSWSNDPNNAQYIAPGTLLQKTTDIYVDDMSLEADEPVIMINVYNGAKVTLIEVWGLQE